MDDIIDPIIKHEIIKKNAEEVYFQNLQLSIIKKINSEWKSNKEIHAKIENKYYNFEYNIIDCYNLKGNRLLIFLNTGKKIQGYNYEDIKNQLKRILID